MSTELDQAAVRQPRGKCATDGLEPGRAVIVVANPLLTSINSVTRAWADADGNYVPNCDLPNFDANGECGPISNRNFGQINPSAQRYTDDLIRGFGTRDYLWDFSAEVQHQLTPRVSARLNVTT